MYLLNFMKKICVYFIDIHVLKCLKLSFYYIIIIILMGKVLRKGIINELWDAFLCKILQE